jgi:hypothetical protein
VYNKFISYKEIRRILMTIKTGERLVATDITDLTFFPKGTILTFSSEAWNATSAEFKKIWKICDGQNGTPNLVNRFLRGGATSDFTAGGGVDTVALTKENLPKHGHTISDPGHKHTYNTKTGTAIQSGSHTWCWVGDAAASTDAVQTGISVNDTFPGQAVYAQAFNVVPKYFTVIYIIKMI